jgi:cytochrome P450
MIKPPPGPPGDLLLGNLRAFAGDVLGFFTSCAREYGPVVRLRLGPREAWLLTDPEDIEFVLVQKHKDFIKHSFFWRHVTAVFGSGLLTNEGEDWLRQRRLMQPAFHKDRIAEYGETMISVTQRVLDSWQPNENRDLHAEMMSLTMQIVSKVLFDADVKSDVASISSAFDDALNEIAARFRRPFRVPDWVPTPGNLRYRRAVQRLDALVHRFIREHRERNRRGTDLLSMLMATRTESGEPMPDTQIRDEAVTLLLAGHETTALVLSWTWALLARHPAASDRLRAELADVLGASAPRVADAQKLRYAEATITESMRLYPPAYALGRESVRDCSIHGFDARAGTTFFIVPWVMHRDPRWFEEPEAFRPERWLDGLEGRLPRYVFMPFGGGPRLCIGNRFAMLEAVLLLALLAQRFQPRLMPDRFPAPFPTVTLRPAGGVPVRLEAAEIRASPGRK